MGELRRGALLLRSKSPDRASVLNAWIDGLEQSYKERIFPVDTAVMDEWATLPTRRTLPVMDSLIAATSLARSSVLVTLNTRDLADLGLRVIDPSKP